MNIERRSLLKGLALGGIAGAAMGASSLSLGKAILGGRAQALPTLVLVKGDAGAAFLEGVRHSPMARHADALNSDLGLDFILALQRRLDSGQPQRIIGLVDDASAALVLDLARSSGARIHWLGQHSVGAAGSRHQVLSAERAHACALQLGRQLQACGGGFDLTAQRQQGQRSLNLAAAPRGGDASAQWAASLGHSLAGLGGTDIAPAPRIAQRHPALAGHFVSFSIEA